MTSKFRPAFFHFPYTCMARVGAQKKMIQSIPLEGIFHRGWVYFPIKRRRHRPKAATLKSPFRKPTPDFFPNLLVWLLHPQTDRISKQESHVLKLHGLHGTVHPVSRSSRRSEMHASRHNIPPMGRRLQSARFR